METQNSKELALMHAKLQADISFLTDRLTRTSQQATPSSAMLTTYTEMLKSKQQVLRRLEAMLANKKQCG